jgi:hypothetical protein
VISAWPTGGITNWPNEPSAVVMPSAIERASAGTARPTAASTMPKPVPPSARPIRRPALTCSSSALAAVAIR